MNVSVVTYNTPEDQIQRLLNTVLPMEWVRRVFIIDNSPQASPYLSSLTEEKVTYRFNNANLGYGKAHNIALRESVGQGADYHLVVNADVEFTASALEDMVLYMNRHPFVALLSPKVLYPDGSVQYLCKQLPTPLDLFARRFLPKSIGRDMRERFEMRSSGYDNIMEVPYLSGCFMLLRVEALRRVGLFDERFFMYPEDIDLTRRLNQHYQTLFYPYQTIIHHHGQASYKSLKMLWIHIINMCRYFNKWGWIYDPDRPLGTQHELNE